MFPYQPVDMNLDRLTGREPNDITSAYLAEVKFGVPYFRGTAARAIAPQWLQRTSGLIVPGNMGGRPAPIDQMSVYFTAEEVFGVPISEDFVFLQLRHSTAEQVIYFAAQTLAEFRRPGRRRQEADRHFAERWFVGSARQRVLNMLRQDNRALVVPQSLLVLAQRSLRVSADCLLPGAEAANLIAAAIAIGDQLGADRNQEIENSSDVVDSVPGPLGRELVANQLFNADPEDVNLIARFHRTWLTLPGERADEPRVVNIAETYERSVGIPLSNVLSVGLGLWASTIQGNPRVLPSYFDALDLPAGRVGDALDVISATIADLRQAVWEEFNTRPSDWSFSTFERFPIAQFYDGSLVVLDIHLLVRRLFSWVPFYDIANGAIGGSLVRRCEQALRYLSEIYVTEVVESIVGATSFGRRAYFDKELRHAYGAQGVKIADVAIDYGGAWVVVEITTTKLRRESVAGMSDEYLARDIDKLVEEVRQIDSTIRSLRRDRSRLTGRTERSQVHQFHPVVVVTEGFPVNPVTLTVLRNRVKTADLLTGSDVTPIEVIDVVELEMVEGLQEEGGPSLAELLDKKARADLALSSFRDFILVELGLAPRRPSRVDELFHEFVELIVGDAFGGVAD